MKIFKKDKTDSKSNIKKQNISIYLISLVVIILVNILVSLWFFRIDLTAEKRYSLSKSTKNIIKSLDDIVYFRVYLDGDIPPGFKRLSKESRELLNEYSAYSDKIKYEFIDPSANRDAKELRAFYNELVKKGLQPTQLQD